MIDLIRDVMEILCLTQKELGVAIGTTQQSVSNWLNGRRGPTETKADNIKLLAIAAGLDLNDYTIKERPERKSKYRGLKPYPRDTWRLLHYLTELSPKYLKKALKELNGHLDFMTKEQG